MIWIEKSLDVLAFIYALLFFPAPVFWLLIHSGIRFWRRVGNRALLWIAAPLWAANAAALEALHSRLFAERIPRNAFTAAAGAALVIAGLAIGHHVHRVFGLKRLGGLPEVSPGRYRRDVVERGVYAYVRHPRYLEYMLSFAGWSLLTGARGILVLAIASVLMYSFVAPLEERELRNERGEAYSAYARAVPRFIPRLRRPARRPDGEGPEDGPGGAEDAPRQTTPGGFHA